MVPSGTKLDVSLHVISPWKVILWQMILPRKEGRGVIVLVLHGHIFNHGLKEFLTRCSKFFSVYNWSKAKAYVKKGAWYDLQGNKKIVWSKGQFSIKNMKT